MENLNDLIQTDEEDNENGDISTQGTEMHKACMVAFCVNNYAGMPNGGCTVCHEILRTVGCLP